MKLSVLKSTGHNVADSLASGASLLANAYDIDIFDEAAKAPQHFIDVDFLSEGDPSHSVSSELTEAIENCRRTLPAFCQRHGFDVSAVRTMRARFAVDIENGNQITVTVEDMTGRRSVDVYAGAPARRMNAQRA